MMRQWTVDAFADAPLKGNPACVLEPFEAWPEAGCWAVANRETVKKAARKLNTLYLCIFGGWPQAG